MKQAMMQRYLSFMAPEISYMSDRYNNTWCYLLKNKKFLLEEDQKIVVKQCEKIKYLENNMSFIQTQVKRAIAGTGEITQSVAQGMEKQIAILIKEVSENREWVKNNKYSFSKQDYVNERDQYKFRLARLVELQQAIRKQKQKGKYE